VQTTMTLLNTSSPSSRLSSSYRYDSAT